MNWIAKKRLDAFERRWRYDAGYMKEIVDEAGVGALMPAGALEKVGTYQRDVPVAVYYAAKLTSTRAADCGPCLQLVTSMAESAGVSHSVLRALVMGDRDALSEEIRLGVDLAEATVARDGRGAAARQQILARWGRRALVSLAYAIVAGQAYPTLKYALGHGRACVRVRIGGKDVAVRATAAA